MNEEEKDIGVVIIDNLIKAKENGDLNEEMEFRGFQRAILRIAPSVFFAFVVSGESHISVDPGLPSDARMVGAFYNHKTHDFNFVVESEEFEIILEGEKLPIIESPRITEYVCPFIGEDGPKEDDLGLKFMEVDNIVLKMETATGLPNYDEARNRIKELLWKPMEEINAKRHSESE